MTLSSIGLPTLNGFIGEVEILLGISQVGGEAFSFFGADQYWWTVLAATGIVLGAAYMLWLYQRTMFGPVTNPKNERLPDLTWREKWTLIPLVVLAFWIGLYPKPFFEIMDAPIHRLVYEQVVPVLRQTGAKIDLPDPSLARPAGRTPAHAGAPRAEGAHGAAE
jgi:NADH-quinone oxidoreductase subunit M